LSSGFNEGGAHDEVPTGVDHHTLPCPLIQPPKSAGPCNDILYNRKQLVKYFALVNKEPFSLPSLPKTCDVSGKQITGMQEMSNLSARGHKQITTVRVTCSKVLAEHVSTLIAIAG